MIEIITQAKNSEAHLLTYFTPMNTTSAIMIRRTVPYTRMLFSIIVDVPPPEVTSPKMDIEGAI